MKGSKQILALVFISGTLILNACNERNRELIQNQSKKDSTATFNNHTGLSIYQQEGEWVTQNNDTITLNDLRGKVQVIAMVFTHCRLACPKIVNDMQKIDQQLPANIKGKVGFTLVSFDVERDTIGQLKAFAKDMGLDSSWILLHGDEQELRKLSMLLDVNYEKLQNGDFGHTNVISILDPNGVIVHRHEGLEMDARAMVDKVLEAAR